jgi:murein DD-endopeptidase MepM/ murein hydrolase activator NlpD
MQDIVATLKDGIKRWFPQRNVIIVSEHKVRHIPISGAAQCVMLMALGTVVCWGAYSTGSYMAARMALKSQTQTLRNIADARVATNFNSLYPSIPLTLSTSKTNETPVQSLASPMFTLSALGNDKLIGRVAFLEQRVAQLQTANTTIIQKVREKSAGRINDLENIIRQVGLNPTALKKEVSVQKQQEPARRGKGEAKQGGPYIPDDMLSMSSAEIEMNHTLDELAVLQQVIDTLPLTYPIRQADEQSQFGHRVDPFTRRLAFHSGLDLAGPAGSRIYSPANGFVTSAGRNGAYGNAIDIEHGFGVSTRYGHLGQVLVKEGQKVKKGDLIGIQGSTGRSTGAHLLYEVRYRARPRKPK